MLISRLVLSALVQEAAHEEGRPGKHNETNGRESRDQKQR